MSYRPKGWTNEDEQRTASAMKAAYDRAKAAQNEVVDDVQVPYRPLLVSSATNVKWIGEHRVSTITVKEMVALRKKLRDLGYSRQVQGYDRGRTSTSHIKGDHYVLITRHYQHPLYLSRPDDKVSVDETWWEKKV